MTNDGGALVVNVLLSETDREVTGNGTLQLNEQQYTVDVSGTHQHPDVSLTLSFGDGSTLNFTGDVDEEGEQMTGTIGEGMITFRKQ